MWWVSDVVMLIHAQECTASFARGRQVLSKLCTPLSISLELYLTTLGMHLPPVPICAFVLEPEVQVGTGPINQASRLNGHAHH
jgi:hypothetical protein